MQMIQRSPDVDLPYSWGAAFSNSLTNLTELKNSDPWSTPEGSDDPLQYADPWVQSDFQRRRTPTPGLGASSALGSSHSFSVFQPELRKHRRPRPSRTPQVQVPYDDAEATLTKRPSYSQQIAMESSWSPQQGEDPLQNFRSSMQNGELSKLANHAMPVRSPGGQRRSSVSSNDSSGSGDSPPSPRATTWSAIVQKNTRPAKHGRKQNSKIITISVSSCCANPQIKLICSNCTAETLVREDVKPRLIPVSTSQLGFCRFCQTNGDPPEVYQGHSLRSDDGKVTCPVLREYNCPICNNGGGDFAHTIKYCPMARKAKPSN